MKKIIKKGTQKKCVIDIMKDLTERQKRKLVCEEYNDETFRKSSPMSFKKSLGVQDNCQEIKAEWKHLCREFSERNLSSEFVSLVSEVEKASSIQEIWTIYEKVLQFFEGMGLEIIKDEDFAGNIFKVKIEAHKIIIECNEQLTLKDGFKPKSFIELVVYLNYKLRSEKRLPTKDEYFAFQVAKFYLNRDASIDYPYQDWGTSGFRKIQTWMSITDPGLGHIFGTSTKHEYLEGIICHIEHLERANTGRHQIESYRIPCIKDVSVVRLCIGSSAPISSYIGRPQFENGFYHGLLKTVNTIASAVSQMFSLGLCECKIAIEGMTATESIHFMQCIAGAVKRDEHRQILSAAFNINTPILDDRRQYNHWVKDRFEIGLLGIELAVAGGFDKVTWDGSAETYPSKCILKQLSHAEAIELVHKAHEKGLLTYFSAGFRYHHLPSAVYTGVDGVGVGGAQILRYMDKKTGYHGPFKPENISEILKVRNEAMNNWQGKSAELLARLDRMYSEGSLAVSDNELRIELFEAAKNQNQKKCEELLEYFTFVSNLPSDTQNPLVEWGKRIIRAGDNCMMAKQKFSSSQEWNSFISNLKEAIEDEDLDWLTELLKPQTRKAEVSYIYPHSKQQAA